MAGGDVDKIDNVTSQPLEKCLLLLSYKADKALLESLLYKEMNKGLK